MITHPISLLPQAHDLATALPPLLVQAQHLAATMVLGGHGRRRPGMGDAFWQFRPAQTGDGMRHIDWRRSARADDQFVRQTEWQIAQTLQFWVDPGASMQFGSGAISKAERAHLLTLALTILLIQSGERVAMMSGEMPTRSGMAQVDRIDQALAQMHVDSDYAAPDTTGLIARSKGIFMSDFMGDMVTVERALGTAADRGVTGAIMMIIDPQEQDFPFQGRSVFHSMAGSIEYETNQAADLKDKYLNALHDRITHMRHLARAANWQFHLHVTHQPAQSALLWLYHALGAQR